MTISKLTLCRSAPIRWLPHAWALWIFERLPGLSLEGQYEALRVQANMVLAMLPRLNDPDEIKNAQDKILEICHDTMWTLNIRRYKRARPEIRE